MTFNSSPRQSPARMSGFTLVELMVTVTVVAILAAMALPSYASYIARARRAEARTQLVLAAHFMQRFYASNDSFSTDRAGETVFKRMPEGLKQSPGEGTKIYKLVFPDETLSSTSFELRMEPLADGVMGSDECGAFTLTSTGVRGVLVDSVTDTGTLRDTCWK